MTETPNPPPTQALASVGVPGVNTTLAEAAPSGGDVVRVVGGIATGLGAAYFGVATIGFLVMDPMRLTAAVITGVIGVTLSLTSWRLVRPRAAPRAQLGAGGNGP
jgi:hypothetical protein